MAKRLLDDQPISITVYPDSAQLLRFRHAEKLISLVNDSFTHANKPFFDLTRLKDVDDLIDQVGADSFSVLATSTPDDLADEPTFYAIGSAHPFNPTAPSHGHESIWKYRSAPGEDLADVQRWELKIVCTNTDFKRQGLGFYIMDLLELEIKRRFRTQQLADRPCRRLQLVLTTIKELNGAWYERRGYRICNEIFVEKGLRPFSRLSMEPNYGDFHICSMNRFLDVD